MTSGESPSDEQHKIWNGPAGQAWVQSQQLLDRIFTPFQQMLIDALPTQPRARVLDVGCGTGSTTIALAQHATAPLCTGVDISTPMLAMARERAKAANVSAEFVCADAQHHPFEAAVYDAIVSRFGVMFFEDFAAAFRNLRRSAQNGARLRLLTWRTAAENPFMTTAERAAAPLLPSAPQRRTDGPGQFALAVPQRIQEILQESSWKEVEIVPVDVACAFPEAQLEHYFTRLGPLGIGLSQLADEALKARIIDTVRTAFAPFVHEGEVRFTAACFRIDAQAS